ncbi:hypothetical protein OG849_16055 [Streptomyces cyaneofuscatus]|uniref:Transposase n=1 Tax=Streptomyces cyaneofuscatus TaxID=66883 RepID=A0ABZ1EX81_9ACTN|nr:hypothetical protein [Streptomyces cyaneofuscatus]WSB08653.1 hypothetical protein OG849_16055 [Streptomyces cyaneofuscatus]WSD47813.1 hypothetical protein OG857_19350 [Streptomyces cyaneofuscatus]WTA91168.1 hypothetical protein OG323_20245 [Streptomyces cyaneofuscatus]
MGRGDLTDEQWAMLEPLLPKGARLRNRAVATRYDKLAVRDEATVLVAAINEWL